MPEVFQFVDSVSATPSVRLNLNSAPSGPWTVGAETEFGYPPMKRAVSSTMLRDGEYVGATAYGNRELKLVLFVKGATEDLIAAEKQKLARELDRTTNILKYQPTAATHPVFFRTFRTAIDSEFWDPDLRTIRMSVLAEPFALGLRVDVGSVSVSQNPAAGANGCFIDVNSVKGDVETPLMVTYDGLVDPGTGIYASAEIATAVRAGSPYPTLFRQAESLTLGTDTSAVADAAFSGSSKARISFATNNTMGVARLTGTFPTGTVPAGAENRGTYRVFIRCRSVTGLQTYSLQVNSEPVVTQAINAFGTIIELGRLTVHDVQPAAPGYDGSTFGLSWLPSINLFASRATASDQLDIDYILLMPADYRYGTVGIARGTASNDLAVLDGPNDTVYSSATALFTTPRLSFFRSSPRTGALPYVRPGDNRVFIYQTEPADSSGVGSRITDTLNVAAYYWPRYLHVRPLSS